MIIAKFFFTSMLLLGCFNILQAQFLKSDTLANGATYKIDYATPYKAKVKRVALGNFVTIHYTRILKVANNADKIMYSTRAFDKVDGLVIDEKLLATPKKQDIGLTKLYNLAEGDSITIYTDVKKIIRDFPAAEKMLGNSGILINIYYVEKIYKSKEVFFNTLKKSGDEKLKNYIEKNNLLIFYKAKDSIYIKVTKLGEIKKIEKGNYVRLKFIGKKLNNKQFISSLQNNVNQPNANKNDSIINFVVGNSEIIKGLDLAMKYLSKGAQATIVLPYYMAYGNKGNQLIPPYENVILEVDIVDVLPKRPDNEPEPNIFNGSLNINEQTQNAILNATKNFKGLIIRFDNNKAILSGKISQAESERLNKILLSAQVMVNRNNLIVE